MNEKRSPWREPMVWLVFGLPAFAVAASFGLLSQALRGGPNDVVLDEVRHTADSQVADFGPDARAGQLHLSATLRVSEQGLEVVPVTGSFDRSQALTLTLAHPANDDQDHRESLAPGESGWAGAPVPLGANDWIVRLDAADGSWRLRGRLARDQRAILLTPALPGS